MMFARSLAAIGLATQFAHGADTMDAAVGEKKNNMQVFRDRFCALEVDCRCRFYILLNTYLNFSQPPKFQIIILHKVAVPGISTSDAMALSFKEKYEVKPDASSIFDPKWFAGGMIPDLTLLKERVEIKNKAMT